MVKKFLTSPLTIVISMVLGSLVGLFFKGLIPALSVLDTFYLSLLKMTSLPIIICAITINIGKILNKRFKSILGAFFLYSFILVLISSIIPGVVCHDHKEFIKPDDNTTVSLMKISDKRSERSVTDYFSELNLYDDNDVANDDIYTFKDFLLKAVPENIFVSVAEEQMIQVVIICIIFGVMFAVIDKRLSSPILRAVEGVYEAVYKFLNFILLLIPFSVFMTFAEWFNDPEMLTLFSLLFKIMTILFLCIIVSIVNSFIVIQIMTKCSFKDHWIALKRTLFVAAGTGERSAVITVTMEDARFLGLEKDTVESMIPVNTLLFPAGRILQAVVITMYISIIYNLKISFSSFLIIVISSLFYSISISSATSIVAASMLGVIFAPLGLPTDVGALIWIVMDMFFEELEVFSGVYANLAVVSIIDHKLKKVKPKKRIATQKQAA